MAIAVDLNGPTRARATHSAISPQQLHSQTTHSERNCNMTASRENVFIDQNVFDLHSLLAGLRGDVEPIVLTASAPATAQIARALKGRDDIHAVHVIAHGGAGEVRFGAGVLSRETLDDHAAELADNGRALGADGDLLRWSCNTAEGERGAAFVAELAHLIAVPTSPLRRVASARKRAAGGGNSMRGRTLWTCARRSRRRGWRPTRA